MGKQLDLDMKEIKKSNGANLGFEEKMWKAADKLRNNMDAAEYKHVVLGLIFLKSCKILRIYWKRYFREIFTYFYNIRERVK